MQFDLTPEQRRLQIRARELARGPVAERAAEIGDQRRHDIRRPLVECDFGLLDGRRKL